MAQFYMVCDTIDRPSGVVWFNASPSGEPAKILHFKTLTPDAYTVGNRYMITVESA